MRQFLWKECMLNDRYWGELRVRALYCVTLVVSYYTLRAGNVWTDPLSIVESLVNVVTMYICLIFFCTLSSFSITFLCCDFVYFWLCTLLKVFLFALVYHHDTFHSLCTVSFCIVYLILFIPSSFRKRCHNLSYFLTVSTNIEFDIGHYCDLQNEWLRTPSPLFYLLNVCQFYNEFGNEHLMTSV